MIKVYSIKQTYFLESFNLIRMSQINDLTVQRVGPSRETSNKREKEEHIKITFRKPISIYASEILYPK